MEDIKSARLANLKMLLKEHGTQRALADALDIVPNQISQWVNGNRAIGEKIARKIEEKLEKGHGWMDALGQPEKGRPVEAIDADLLEKHLVAAIEYSKKSDKEFSTKKLVKIALAAYDFDMNKGNLVSLMLNIDDS